MTAAAGALHVIQLLGQAGILSRRQLGMAVGVATVDQLVTDGMIRRFSGDEYMLTEAGLDRLEQAGVWR